MLRSLRLLLGRPVESRDGGLGTITGFIIDDRFWTLRYLVLTTGLWNFNREIHLSPFSLLRSSWKEGILKTGLMREDLAGCRDLDLSAPQRQQPFPAPPYLARQDLLFDGDVPRATGKAGRITELIFDDRSSAVCFGVARPFPGSDFNRDSLLVSLAKTGDRYEFDRALRLRFEHDPEPRPAAVPPPEPAPVTEDRIPALV